MIENTKSYNGLLTSEEIRLKPRVGLTGSFGRGNYGDELYLQNYEYWFGECADLHLLTNLPKPNYLDRYSNEYVDLMDTIILGGGDLLVPYRYPIDRDFINLTYLRRPLHVACIGVQRNRSVIDDKVLSQWTDFLNHPNIRSIATRDPGSKKWIEDYINPSVAVSNHPDMICAMPLPTPNLQINSAPILGIVTRSIKKPEDYILLAKIGKMLIKQGWQVQHIIGGVGASGKKDFENSKHLEIDGKKTVYSQDLDDISRALGGCSLVLSMKLHTTLVAAMYGVPTVCVNPVVKAKAFMKSVGCESLVFSPNDPKLLELIESGIPHAPCELKIQLLRSKSEDFMKGLVNQVWSEFRNASVYRAQKLPLKAPLL